MSKQGSNYFDKADKGDKSVWEGALACSACISSCSTSASPQFRQPESLTVGLRVGAEIVKGAPCAVYESIRLKIPWGFCLCCTLLSTLISNLLTCVDGLACPQASAFGCSSPLTRWACSAAPPPFVGRRAARLRRGGHSNALASSCLSRMGAVVRVAHTSGSS